MLLGEEVRAEATPFDLIAAHAPPLLRSLRFCFGDRRRLVAVAIGGGAIEAAAARPRRSTVRGRGRHRTTTDAAAFSRHPVGSHRVGHAAAASDVPRRRLDASHPGRTCGCGSAGHSRPL